MAQTTVTRTPQEIDQCLTVAQKALSSPPASTEGMTYEQGVLNTLQWVIGRVNSPPVDFANNPNSNQRSP